MSSKYQTEFDRENGISSIIDTLGGTGVTQIFIHSVASLGKETELATALPGFEKYPERSLLVARTDDIVCVLERVDNQYLQFLSSLGVGPRNGNVIQASKCLYQNDNAN
ncbi:MAG TPA: hypothetical protein VJ574_01410, partial [Candidatus Bathyarchaeia archaeon]|nr:hypothetical protein [Candidatus Bathyarchaeia archaeon]